MEGEAAVILSISQVEAFDAKQEAGCPRRWWFDRVKGRRPEQTNAQAVGEAGHALLAHYLARGELPPGRLKMGKAVAGVIAKGTLPEPGPDLWIETRFSGQPKLDAEGKWIPVDVDKTLHLGGVPFDGFIDLAFKRGPVPEVWDHKFSSDIHEHARSEDALIQTVQLPVYVAALVHRGWASFDRWRLVYHYVSKAGVESLVRSAVVTWAQVQERLDDVEQVVRQMQVIARAEKQAEVSFNRRACSAYGGCPHQSICKAFTERTTVELTPAEAAAFAALAEPAASAAAPAAPAPAPEWDDLLAPSAQARGKAPGERMLKVNDPDPLSSDGMHTEAPQGNPLDAYEQALKANEAQVLANVQEAAKIPPEELGAAPTAPAPAPAVEVPPPAPAAPAETPPPACACGVQITAENGSQLRGGAWVHVGCKLNAPPPPPPPPAPAKRGRKPKAPEPVADAAAKADVAALAAEVFGTTPGGGVVTERPAPAPEPEPAPVVERRADPLPVTEPVERRALGLAALPALPRTPTAREALATMFEQVAILIRQVG